MHQSFQYRIIKLVKSTDTMSNIRDYYKRLLLTLYYYKRCFDYPTLNLHEICSENKLYLKFEPNMHSTTPVCLTEFSNDIIRLQTEAGKPGGRRSQPGRGGKVVLGADVNFPADHRTSAFFVFLRTRTLARPSSN